MLCAAERPAWNFAVLAASKLWVTLAVIDAMDIHLAAADVYKRQQYAKEQDALNAEITELEKAVTGYEQSRKSAEKFMGRESPS